MGNLLGLLFISFLLVGCGSPSPVEVVSSRSSTDQQSTQVTNVSDIEPAQNFADSHCSKIDYPQFQISSADGCWTEFIYFNNDGENIALHFFPTHGNSGGRIQTITESQNRRLKIYSEIDFLDKVERAEQIVRDTLTDEEKQAIGTTSIKMSLSKLTITSAKTCVDVRGKPPIIGVVSICSSGEPLISYFVKIN